MNLVLNIDLLAVGVAMAANLIFGVVVFINNRKSATSILFLIFTALSVAWSITNYLSYQTQNPDFKLWTIRLVLFFACFFVFSFYLLMRTFPSETLGLPKGRVLIFLGITIFVALFTLSPFVFPSVIVQASSQVAQPVPAFGIAIFGLFVIFFILAGIVTLVKKIVKAESHLERVQFGYLLLGVGLMYGLIVVFNFILPAFFAETQYIPLAPLFIFPFIVCTAYAVFRHHLLNVKVISTEILAFLLAIVTLSDVIFSQGMLQIVFRSGEFVLVLIFGLLLIKSVLREVEQREQLELLNKQIAEKNEQLEELSRFKSQLLSLASHQIRSPLAAIKGYASLVVGGSYGVVPDKAKDAVDKMSKSAGELIGLINTLLDVRKIEEGKMEYQFTKTDLGKIAADVVDLLKPLAETKKMEFTLTTPGHEVWVNADGEKLKQIVQNLTDNAIKYTTTGFVHVVLKEDNGTAVIEVADSGVGVPATLIPYLFEEFVRDERVKKQILGTGLGLYIARKIAEAHGGTISAESAGEGKGSTFRLKVPLFK